MKGVVRVRRLSNPPRAGCTHAQPLVVHYSNGGRARGASSASGLDGDGSVRADSGPAASYDAHASVPTNWTHRARPCTSVVKDTSPPPWANRALIAASALICGAASDSAEARTARESRSFLRVARLVSCLSPRVLRLGQSLCQCVPLHQRHGAHLSLHASSGSGRGRFGSVGFSRVASPFRAKACEDPGLDSSSRLTLRASASLKTLRAALTVSARLPTPELRDNLTSNSVDRLLLSRRTALAIFSDSTASGRRAESGSERLSRCMECTKALKAVTVGSAMPRT
eukprot:2622169-Pleurochrysis_carterae.AAC.3